METSHIPIKATGRFSQLICDYLDENKKLEQFYNNFPKIESFKDQIERKKISYSKEHRNILVNVLKDQYNGINVTEEVKKQLELIGKENTFTITTGHQLCLMTGPLYFIYKIISTINLCKQLKEKYPELNFVPIYWMASEDHDFDEINSFQFKNNYFTWKKDYKGAVGQLSLNDLQKVLDNFESILDNKIESIQIKSLIRKSYRKAKNLAEATFLLVNELFGKNGLIVIEPNNKKLKAQFSPFIKDELLNQKNHSEVIKQTELLKNIYGKNYSSQVTPRVINLFYLTKKYRYRIEKIDKGFSLIGTEKKFSKQEILELLDKHPERFSPNVILRPLYQEVILPNICYIGGAGEIAYWLQLKKMFDRNNVLFPSLLLRNSVLLYSEKQKNKTLKLNLNVTDLFLNREKLINQKIQQLSKINLDLSFLKKKLKKQFIFLKDLSDKTDKSFIGAVRAQEKKQINGINKLEKRLHKAQKRVYEDELNRLTHLHDQLFPNDQLQERNFNFFTFYHEIGHKMIPILLNALDPLATNFTLIKY